MKVEYLRRTGASREGLTLEHFSNRSPQSASITGSLVYLGTSVFLEIQISHFRRFTKPGVKPKSQKMTLI